jgi:hypothetical protein
VVAQEVLVAAEAQDPVAVAVQDSMVVAVVVE